MADINLVSASAAEIIRVGGITMRVLEDGSRTDNRIGAFEITVPPRTVDATVEAQKVLSAVYRTDQVFGAIHIIAVLRGETTDGVLRHSHDKLPTFGLGADHPATYWRSLIRQLIALGALDVDTQGHGGLFLVQDKARPILRGETHVMLREEGKRKLEVVRPDRHIAATAEAGPEAQNLFEALRAWRASEANGSTSRIQRQRRAVSSSCRVSMISRPRSAPLTAQALGVKLGSTPSMRRAVMEQPPAVTVEMAKGFTLFMVQAVMNGRGDELIDLARTNLWR